MKWPFKLDTDTIFIFSVCVCTVFETKKNAAMYHAFNIIEVVIYICT